MAACLHKHLMVHATRISESHALQSLNKGLTDSSMDGEENWCENLTIIIEESRQKGASRSLNVLMDLGGSVRNQSTANPLRELMKNRVRIASFLAMFPVCDLK